MRLSRQPLASLRIERSIACSVTSFFSRAFSKSSSFSRFASSAFIPPYRLRQRLKVRSLTPSACTTCATLIPAARIASASRSLPMNCSGVCLVRFIFESLPDPIGVPRDSHRTWISFRGAGHREEGGALRT